MKGIKVVAFNLILFIGLITFFELLTRKIINFELFYYEMNQSTTNRDYNLHPYGEIPINTNGFYDKEWDSPKTKYRFAYTGDSVVYGVGAGFPNRLTEYLDSFKTDIEHINISKGIGTNILSMGSENEIIDLLKRFNIDKLVYILNLNDISPLAFQFNSKNEYDPKKISKFARLKKFINPVDKKLRGRSTLYSLLRFQFKNFLVLKQGLNISGFKAIELEPIKNEKDIKNAARKLAILLNNLKSNSIDICTLILPYEMQISENAAKTYRELGVPFENQFLDFKTQKIFIEEFNLYSDLEIHYLGKQFDQKPVGHFYVFDKGDRIDFNHPNGKGHYVLAKEIVSRELCY